MAVTIGGVISAPRISELTSAFAGMTWRVSAKAAGTPSKVAISAERLPTLSVTQSALTHSGSRAMLSYQRNEKPGGGNTRKLPELNEIATTTMTGKMR